MVKKEDKMCIRAMLTSAITALCRTKLGFKSAVNIEGLLGITIDKDDIFLVNINECIAKHPEHLSGEENNNSGTMTTMSTTTSSTPGEVHNRDITSYNTNLEGVTGEKIEAVLVKNKEDDRDLARVSAVIQGGLDNIKTVSTAAAIMATGKMAEKYAKSMDSQSSTDPSEYEGYDSSQQGKAGAGEAMVGCSTWSQNTEAGGTPSSSQTMAVTSPLVTASISQMSGIAQTTQLEDQRRKSRDHMRRYRQQLRESNYSEYEERKRRQREGMRRYRERLRMENPEKYAEMNRKHAEQERRRRLRARSLSESHLKSPPPSANILMRTGQQGTETRQKLAPPDFLHMAMETSQLFQARDMHQLLQAGLPVSSNSLAMVTGSLGTVGVGPNSVTITGPLALAGVTQVAVEEVQQSQQAQLQQAQQQHQAQNQQQQQPDQQQQNQPQQQQHQTVAFSEAQQQQATTSTTTQQQQQQQMINEHIHRMGGAGTPNQALTIQRQPLTSTERTTTVTLAPMAQIPQTLSTVS